KKFSWAVTKHISDSFNLPESLAGFRLVQVVLGDPFEGETNYRIFRNKNKGSLAKKFTFFHFFR
uniref:hypothetical protein n=1 Tax=Fibrobacter sp. TaxID=35828 RepID=UPI00386337A1